MYYLQCLPGKAPEIRIDLRQRSAQDFSPHESRAFMRLASSADLANIWLATLTANVNYATSTVFEYGKVLCSTLNWLALEPVQLATATPVGNTLLHLSRGDMHALFAWFTIPAKEEYTRRSLAKSGVLPATYRSHSLSASINNVRVACLTRFFDWVLDERDEGETMAVHPLRLHSVTRSHNHVFILPEDNFLTRPSHEPGSGLSLHRYVESAEPDALDVEDLHLLFAAIPHVSRGHNAANRNGAIVRLLLYGMFRRSELTAATWEAVDDIKLSIVGKRGKPRRVTIPEPVTWNFVQAYTNDLRLPATLKFHGPILRQLDHEDRPLTRNVLDHLMQTLRTYVAALAQQQRLHGNVPLARHYTNLAAKLHSHIFRATGATYLAAGGLSLVHLAKMLGHSDPLTTQRYYLAAEQLDLPEAVRQIWAEYARLIEQSGTEVNSVPDDLGWYQRRGWLPAERMQK